MSRRVKHTPEQKVKIVRAVLEGYDSKEGIARQYGISTGRIHEWIVQYKVNGIAAFISKCRSWKSIRMIFRSAATITAAA